MLCDNLTIRHTGDADLPALAAIHNSAFETPAEADLVEALITGDSETLSLLAECDGRPAGHILLTKLDAPVRAMALSPIAVTPHFREMQVGSALVRAAMDAARSAGYEAVFVLGEQGFYERFGFSASLAASFEAPWKGPHFMALELTKGSLSGKFGPLTFPGPLQQ